MGSVPYLLPILDVVTQNLAEDGNWKQLDENTVFLKKGVASTVAFGLL